MRVNYTQITFATPRARVEYAEASLEVKARAVVAATNDPQDLGYALDDLRVEVEELDSARRAERADQDAARSARRSETPEPD